MSDPQKTPAYVVDGATTWIIEAENDDDADPVVIVIASDEETALRIARDYHSKVGVALQVKSIRPLEGVILADRRLEL